MLALALIFCANPVFVGAQRVVPTLDVGASSMRLDDRSRIAATTLSPGLRIESASLTGSVSASHSKITSGGWTTQGSLVVSSFAPIAGRFHGELVGTAGGSAHQDDTRTGQMLVQGRAHFMGTSRGLWIGSGVGRAWDGTSPHRLTVIDAGAWVSSGNATLLIAALPTSISEPAGTGLRYTDASVAARWVGEHTELGAALGARVGDALPSINASSSGWGNVSAALWIAGPVALVASAGSYPVDYTQNYPGGRFAAIAVRLGGRPPTPSARSDASARLSSTPAPAGPLVAFLIGPSADRRHRTIVVSAPTAAVVEVSGDFTAWQPIPLTRRRDGRWAATLPIPVGTHEIAVRVDRGAWMAPPGLTAIRDEFGGMAGILVIKN